MAVGTQQHEAADQHLQPSFKTQCARRAREQHVNCWPARWLLSFHDLRLFVNDSVQVELTSEGLVGLLNAKGDPPCCSKAWKSLNLCSLASYLAYNMAQLNVTDLTCHSW